MPKDSFSPASHQDQLDDAARLYREGQHQKAHRIVAQVLERAPENAAAHYLAGTFANIEGHSQQAMERLQASIRLNPWLAITRLALARTYLNAGDHARCRQQARAALALDPDLFDAHLLLAHGLQTGPGYHRVLNRTHQHLRPANYLETGVAAGESIRLTVPSTCAVGIDPKPQIDADLPPHIQIFAETSDAFFARANVLQILGNRPLALGFIDGMHLFEYALRDFIQMENIAAPDSIIFVHDCYPINSRTAERQRITQFWSGDVWKLMVCLQKERPDLEVATLNCPPTGLGMIRKLDPANRHLATHYQRICKNYTHLPFGVIEHDAPTALKLLAITENDIPALLEKPLS